MTSAMKGAVGWAPQVGLDDGATTPVYTWHKAVQANIGLQRQVTPYQFEVGGSVLQSGAYVGLIAGGGTLRIQPRLYFNSAVSGIHGLAALFASYAGGIAWQEDPGGTPVPFVGNYAIDINTLPASIMGTSTDWNDLGVVGVAREVVAFPGYQGTGAGTNIKFGFDEGDGARHYLTFRSVTPKANGDYIGETFYNCRVANMRWTLMPNTPLGMDINIVGGVGDEESSELTDKAALETTSATVEAWGFQGAMADISTIPQACNGWIKLGIDPGALSENKYVQQAIIDFGGNMRPQDRAVIGQHAPIDLTMLSRVVQIRLSWLWQTEDFYKASEYGGSTTPSPIPYETPIWLMVESPDGTYQMGFVATKVFWQATPPVKQGEAMLIQEVIGTVAERTDGAPWFVFLAHNDMHNSVTWPAA